ncbi:predicted pyridoxal phosphate-dependent enzyme [Pelotomaculum thermopropionicum SI]|uniref:Predicted pyridoxal phosphate-dependent enzyme n=1 Tax=Pelotomaculum thermopropionicum (strain DSM 13744 / JCM 10971 / SI) TaxID=370438 RepID=A5D394_PELTS|nr:predicted pyridoxal phosphate-dependent enzyme [Pelotomaculum thermopropionicum SI]
MTVALFDLKRQYQSLENEITGAIREVLAGGEYILGRRVQMLEEQVAAYCGARYGVGVASGTDALFLSLAACGVGRGDEVITTPFTFFATAGAISRTGAIPVFADIDPRTFNIDPEKIEARITGRTRAVVPVHIFGQMADMDAILEIAGKYGLAVIEDACQAIGSENKGRKAGSLGLAGCFSFFPAKNLGCCGDGGMIVTSNEKLAARIRSLRAHGSSKKFFHETIGCNSRLDEIQAAVLLVKLKYLEKWLNRRAALAGLYSSLLKGAVVTPFVAPGNRHTYHLYVIRTPRREAVKRHLEKNGVSCGLYYPLPLHLQPAYQWLGYRKGDFPEAEKASEELLAIPLYPELTRAEVERIALLVRQGVQS